MSMDVLLVWSGSVLLTVVCLWGSLRLRARQRLLRDLPTSQAQGVFIGLVELKGLAESEAPLRSHLAERPCVHYRWRIEEHWSRTVTETYRDKDGRTRTRTRQQTGWETVARGQELRSFYLRDASGIVRVQPEGAKIEPTPLFAEVVRRNSPLYHGKGPARAVSGSTHRRRFTEEGIPLHTPLYVVGPARERSDVVAAELAAAKDAPLFLISTRDEAKVQRGYAIWSWFVWALGLATAVGGTFLVSGAMETTPTPVAWIVLAVGLYLAAWGASWSIMVYNSLVSLRQRVRQAWSLIDVQLKRRHDLIPPLVQAVSGLSGHEREVQTVTPPGQAGPDPTGLATGLRMLAEHYPQLTAAPGYARLFQELTVTEQRIALARAYYNDIATHLATRTQQIPDAWLARLTRIGAEPLLLTADFERAVVNVQFVD
jgi:hypothetical protein